jgi:hypothetical protein
VLPPGSQIGPITPEQRKALIQGSLVAGVYEKVVDRESAYEKLKGRAQPAPPMPKRPARCRPGAARRWGRHPAPAHGTARRTGRRKAAA